MPWLLRDDEVLATLEVAGDGRSRTRGLLGRDGCDGALLLQPARAQNGNDDVLVQMRQASQRGEKARLAALLPQARGHTLTHSRSVHTIGMRFAIDVAFCDRDLRVLRIVTMRPHRLGRPCLKAACAIEAEAGALAHWELQPGDQLEIRE